MPRARNTSPAAKVCRFNGGQFAIDSDEGVNVKNFSAERTHDYKATNLDGYTNPRGKKPTEWAANVGVHPGAPNLEMQADSDEGINVKNYGPERIQEYRTKYAGAVTGPKRVADAPAHVGGGHERKHQG